MRYGDAKTKVLVLLDEYTVNGQLEDDLDIKAKLPSLFDLHHKNMALLKPIVHLYHVPLRQSSGRVAYPMPSDFDRLIKLWSGGVPMGGGDWRGRYLLLDGNETRDIVVEYRATPADITDETPDSFELEIDEDACLACCYHVAADVLVSDLVMDNSKLLAEANLIESRFVNDADAPSMRVMTEWGGFNGYNL